MVIPFPVSREKLLSAFQSLIGEPLTDMTRYVGCQRFEFGVQKPGKTRKGEDTTYGDWFLVVSCDWSITRWGKKIVSSDDFGPKRERRDETAMPFYQQLGIQPPYIECMDVETNGALRFEMTDGVVLTITSDMTEPHRWAEYGKTRSEILVDGEQWRFFPKAEDEDDDPEHWVMTGEGLYEPADRDLKRFFDAVFADNVAKVRRLLEQGIRPQRALEEEYGTTLRYAAIESTPEMVQLLLEYGIGVEEYPSLIDAARSGQRETVRLFLERGGDINERDEIGWTPLMEAASWGSLDIVRFLIEHGADVNLRTTKGDTAFRVSGEGEQPEVTAYLQIFNPIGFEEGMAK